MLGADPAFLGLEVSGRKGFLCWDLQHLASHFHLYFLPLKILGMVGVGTLSNGFLLYVDNLIYCFM